MRYRKSRDGNEAAICAALEAIPGGRVTVAPIEGAGTFRGRLPRAGVPDLLVGVRGIDGRPGRTHLLEVKNPEARPTSTKVKAEDRHMFDGQAQAWNPSSRTWAAMSAARWARVRRVQLEWARDWTGGPVRFVASVEEAAAAIGMCLRCGADDPGGLCPPCELDGVT